MKRTQKKLLDAPQADNHLDAGDAWLAKGQYRHAIREYERAIQANTKPVVAYSNWGLALATENKHKEAIEKYRKALQIDEAYIPALCNLAISLYECEEYQESIETCLKILDLDSTEFSFTIWIKVLDEVRQVERSKAMHSFEKTVARAGNEADLYYAWGQALFKHKYFLEAAKLYKRAIKIRPGLVVAYNEWGRTLYAMNDYEEAIKKYSQALVIDGNYFPAAFNSGLAFRKLELYDEAVKSFERAIGIDPKSGVAHANLARVLSDQKQYDQANKHYEKAVSIEPLYVRTYWFWTASLYANGQYKAVIAQSLKAVGLGSDYVNFEVLLNAIDTLNAGEKEETETKLEEAIQPGAAGSDSFFKWGLALAGLNRYDDAIEKYREATRRQVKCVEAYCSWGDALMQKTRYAEAIEKYKRAARIKPDDFVAQNQWANALFTLHRYLEATEKYLKVIQIDPNAVDYRKWIGVLDKLESEDARYFVELLSQFLKSSRDKGDAYNNWGWALFEQKEYERAIEQYKKAALVKPNFADVYNNWGLALFYQGNYAEASKLYQVALEIRDDHVYSHLNLGLVLHRLEKYDEAIKQFKNAVEVNVNFAPAYNGWGNTLVKQKKHETAVTKFLKTMELDPNSVTYGNWVTALDELDVDDRDNSVEALQKLIEGKPRLVDAWLGWGEALRVLRRYDEAKEKFESVIKVQPGNADAYLSLADVLGYTKNYEQAIEAYRRATCLRPAFVTAYFNWGYTLVEQKKYTEALLLYEKANELGPDDPYPYHNIANYYWTQGRYRLGRDKWEAARRAYERSRESAKVSGNADEFQYHGGILHDVFGDLEEAEKIYREGLKIDPNHIGIQNGLISLYLEKKDEDPPEEANVAYWKARELYKKNEEALKEQIGKDGDAKTRLDLAQLYVAMEDYTEAESVLTDLLQGDGAAMSQTYLTLGVVFTRRENFKKGIESFEKALQLNRNDLLTWSNLAEACLKAKRYERAEQEYKSILGITADHIESQTGLGHVYIALGEKGDGEMFDDAIQHLTEGINLAESMQGSRRLKKKDLAAVYYSRGYARVNLYESAKVFKDESHLQKALEDFRNCEKLDPSHTKAGRALKKIESRLSRFSSQRVTERGGRAVVMVFSAIIFVLAQASFFFRHPATSIDGKYYVIMTFGALAFMIAGLFLPQLLKLKVPGFELEKSTLDQITTAVTLGITK